MAPKPRLYMIGLITKHMARSHDFYRRLGVDFGAASGTHREAKVPALTFFLDDQPSVWHSGVEERPYPWLLKFYFESQTICGPNSTSWLQSHLGNTGVTTIVRCSGMQ
jgi:hypothetical protein